MNTINTYGALCDVIPTVPKHPGCLAHHCMHSRELSTATSHGVLASPSFTPETNQQRHDMIY